MRITLLAADVAQARPLQDALALRGAPCEVAIVDQVRFDFAVRRRMDTVVNLIGEHHDPAVRLLLGDVLAWLGDIGASVVNGLDAFVVASSPARQMALFAHLGLDQPAARIIAGTDGVAAACADLGLRSDEVEILAGPPAVVRARTPGAHVRLTFVGGRLVGDPPQGLSELALAAAAEVLGTASIEFGTVTLARHGDTLEWHGVGTQLGDDRAAIGALANYVAFRAGVGDAALPAEP